MKKALLAIAVLATALVACNKVENEASLGPKAVRFTVENLGTYSFKSATLELGEEGCSNVGIYAADLGANNIQATVSGSTLTPSTTIYWGVGQSAASTFVARYPYADGAGVSGTYNIPEDQTAEDTYTYHANVMTAVQSASPDPGTVAFSFKHPFAKVVVSITNNLGSDAVASVVMKQVKLNATTFDMSTAPATVVAADTYSDVHAYAASATRYELILLPQAATAAMDIVVTTTLGSVYTFRITGDYTFQAGKTATANVTLNPVGGIDGGRTAVGALTFDTVDWTDGDATTVGTIGDPTVGNYVQIGGCVYATEDKGADAWATYYYMTPGAENSWSITVNYDEAMTDDESGQGFKVRLGETYYGMWKDSDNIGTDPYVLGTDGDHQKNIKFPQTSGNYTVTFNSSTLALSYVRNGDAE